jgi:hypothetical protein
VVAEYESLRARYASAVRTLQDIAAKDTSGVWKLAQATLIQLGEPVEPEGM